MKRYLSKVVFHSMIVLITTISAFGQKPADRCSDGDLEVSVNKFSYVRLEPIVANVRLETNDKLSNQWVSFKNLHIRVQTNGESKSFRQLSHVLTIKDPVGLPKSRLHSLLLGNTGSSKESRKILEDSILVERVGVFFPKSGIYSVQFFVPNPTKNCELRSKPIDIQIEPPKGQNLKALQLLQKYKAPLSFDWVWQTKDGVTKLEDFIVQNENSVYTEYAIAFLGNFYLMKGDFVKAKNAFIKIEKSTNKIISEQAKSGIMKIKKCELLETESHR